MGQSDRAVPLVFVENAADMLGEIGELVYFENFNEFNEQTLVSDGTTYSNPIIYNEISVTGYDSLKVTYSCGYISPFCRD